ncbi:hypothetical protein E2C01_017928 [Portunus trituberculatus]|uniref:Uncharacterized protein n=1 Tax=Portunus trituberculatus TaxID=210409 RepID=A0A5B7DVC2_PORTR|nr:hypothetical protein [Portunus trituberculatus]
MGKVKARKGSSCSKCDPFFSSKLLPLPHGTNLLYPLPFFFRHVFASNLPYPTPLSQNLLFFTRRPEKLQANYPNV